MVHLLNRLRGTPVARKLRSISAVDRLYQASQGFMVDQPLRFALNELRPRPTTQRYRLKGPGSVVVIRHHTMDVAILEELLRWRMYDMPGPVEEALGDSEMLKVVDIGAHIGLFSLKTLVERPGSSVLAVEPDAHNALVQQRIIELNRLSDRWRLVRACAGTSDGVAYFRSGRGADSHVVHEPDGADAVPVVDAFDHIADADLLKVDAEGAEWAILSDERLRTSRVRALVLEYHRRFCPERDSRATAERLLEDAGFGTRCVYDNPEGLGIMWAWRKEFARAPGAGYGDNLENLRQPRPSARS